MKENYAGTRHMPVLNIINVNDIYPEIKEPNKLYDTYNYGQFKILGISKFIKYSNGRLGYRLNIQFINTGNICDISLSCARGGQIKDRMQKGMIYSVGYLGNSSKKVMKENINYLKESFQDAIRLIMIAMMIMERKM